MTLATKELEVHWANIAPLLSIRNEREYNAAVKRLNELLDEIGDNEKHPLYGLLDTLGTLIEIYEEEHNPFPDVTGQKCSFRNFERQARIEYPPDSISCGEIQSFKRCVFVNDTSELRVPSEFFIESIQTEEGKAWACLLSCPLTWTLAKQVAFA